MKLSTRYIEVGGAGLEIVGISADLDVSVGYDNGMRLWPGDDVYADLENEWFDEEPPLSVAERIEVCNIMVEPPAPPSESITAAAKRQLDATIAEVQRFAGQCFDEKSQQYNRYAADMEKGLDNEIADLEVRVRELREQSRDQSLALDQKLALQREASRLDRHRDEMLADRFARKRKIQDEVDKMLDRVAESLKLEPQVEPVFTLRWELTR